MTQSWCCRVVVSNVYTRECVVKRKWAQWRRSKFRRYDGSGKWLRRCCISRLVFVDNRQASSERASRRWSFRGGCFRALRMQSFYERAKALTQWEVMRAIYRGSDREISRAVHAAAASALVYRVRDSARVSSHLSLSITTMDMYIGRYERRAAVHACERCSAGDGPAGPAHISLQHAVCIVQ